MVGCVSVSYTHLYNSMEHYLPLLEAKRKAAVEQVVFAPVRDESNEENVENNE